MKKTVKKVFALLCAVALAFALAACSGSKDKKDNNTDPGKNDAASDSAAGDASADEAEASGKFASIQDFIDSDLFRKHMDPQISEFKEKGLSMSFSSKENQLIWNFKVDNPELSGAMDPASLASALDSQASAFESVAGTLKTAVDVDNPTVLVRYLDNEGTELASREFTAAGDIPETDSASGDAAPAGTDAAE